MQISDWFGWEYDPAAMTDIVADYRHAFLKDAASKRVLMHLLNQMNLFAEVKDDEGVALSNMGKRLLSYCGIWLPANLEDIVGQLSKINGGYNATSQ